MLVDINQEKRKNDASALQDSQIETLNMATDKKISARGKLIAVSKSIKEVLALQKTVRLDKGLSIP